MLRHNPTRLALILLGFMVLFATPSAQSVPSENRDSSMVNEQILVARRAKYAELLAQYGKDHPTVQKLKFQIESLEEVLAIEVEAGKSSPSALIDTQTMSDVELRKLIGLLVNRVDVLERDIQALKKPKFRVELLSP